jgi:hypothetical protein
MFNFLLLDNLEKIYYDLIDSFLFVYAYFLNQKFTMIHIFINLLYNFFFRIEIEVIRLYHLVLLLFFIVVLSRRMIPVYIWWFIYLLYFIWHMVILLSHWLLRHGRFFIFAILLFRGLLAMKILIELINWFWVRDTIIISYLWDGFINMDHYLLHRIENLLEF